MRKNMADRVNPELAGPLKMFLAMTGEAMDLHNIPAARDASSRMMAAMKGRLPIIEGVGHLYARQEARSLNEVKSGLPA
jgi:hypothetical protein